MNNKILISIFSIALLLFLGIREAEGICCHAQASCNYCDDCTPATPFCATGSCNIFGCNCDGSCRTGTLCPIGAVGRRGQTVVAGPNCGLPYEYGAPHCAITFPGNPSWQWVHACTTRGRRRRSIESFTENNASKNGTIDVFEVIKKADENSDGKLSFPEVLKYMLLNNIWSDRSNEEKSTEFRKFDRDSDGFLSPYEIE